MWQLTRILRQYRKCDRMVCRTPTQMALCFSYAEGAPNYLTACLLGINFAIGPMSLLWRCGTCNKTSSVFIYMLLLWGIFAFESKMSDGRVGRSLHKPDQPASHIASGKNTIKNAMQTRLLWKTPIWRLQEYVPQDKRQSSKSEVQWSDVRWNGAVRNLNRVKPNERVVKCGEV